MKSLLLNPISRRQLLLVVIDAAIIVTSFMISYFIRIYFVERLPLELVFGRPTWIVWAAVIIHLIVLYVFELYDLQKIRSVMRMLILVLFAVCVASLILALLSYMDLENKLGRVVLVTHIPITVLALFGWRKLYFKASSRFLSVNRLLLIGDSPINQEILRFLNSPGSPISQIYMPVLGILDYHDNPGLSITNGETLGESLQIIVDRYRINTVVVSKDLKELPRLREELVKLRFNGLSIYDAPVFYKKIAAKVPVFYIKDGWFIFEDNNGVFDITYARKIKRLLDVLLSSVALLLGTPVMLVCAMAINVSSKGPVFFRQERLGRFEKPFVLNKFRTMVKDAEKNTGPKWSERNDPRITRVGRFLRKIRLDELPQFYNVLKGDMSIVGPRPIRRHFADLIAKKVPYYRLRFFVKPGITGWAQVKYDYAGSEEGQMEKLQYELFYIQNQSIYFDIYIILKTVQTLIFRPGE